MKKIFFIIFFLFFFFGKQNSAFAVENCSGKVSDERSIGIAGVSVETHSGTFGNFVKGTKTDGAGNYLFTVNCFGATALCTQEVVFKKDGYVTKRISTLTKQDAHCPGDVTLSTVPQSSQSGYACDPNSPDPNTGCVQTSSNAQYSTFDQCNADCKKLKFDPRTGTCNLPDNLYHQQGLECSKASPTAGFGSPLPTPSSTPAPLVSPCKDGFCPTAFGINISTKPADLVKTIFGILLSLAGGVAIILIMISGYRLMGSSGNPEKVQAAREQLTSAIVGLLFIIFSITILQIIGVQILHIPGLNP